MNYDNVKIPNHVGLILDGNGRWAKKRGLSRSEGHNKGFDNLKTLSKYILSKGIRYLSIYVFSTENFNRSNDEVNYLMNLFTIKFKTESKYFMKENIKVVFSGRKEPLPNKVYKSMMKLAEDTKNNTGGVLNICLNYGSHAEIIDATKKIVDDVIKGILDIEKLDEKLFGSYFYNELPPVDLLIRTSGEVRLSNFMLWQNSYAELYFPKTLFPDFDEFGFDDAIIEYTKRDRRFGGIDYEDKNN